MTDIDSSRTDTTAPKVSDVGDLHPPKPTHVKLFLIEMKRDTAYYIVDLLCLLLLIFSFVFVAVAVQWDAYIWRFYVGFGCLMILCIIIAEVNHHNKFQSMTAWFYHWRYPLIVIFFILALADFILLELSDVSDDCDYSIPDDPDCPIFNPDEDGVRYVTRFATIVVGTLFICCVMGYWERVSYLSAHNSWVIAILYMSVIGAIFLYFARCLEPPPKTEQEQKENWSWHQPRSTNKILKIVVNLMIVVVLFFVIMGSIVLAIFGDASRSSETLGTWSAMFIFIIIAHIIMITPLAPGSVVDVCAGFLFVSLFVNNEGARIESAYFVSLAITIALHFSGSCAQYYVGKIPAVQIWANKTLPPEMLAASDSVLKTAGWFKVGVVGQVFMDTANGLNQGRMDMAFCTQFWSEYASIPNALGLVSLGTILAIPSFGAAAAEDAKRYDWAEDAIPLVFMITSLWQMIASSWGAKELLASSGTVPYWTALEKWATVQYFYNKGYVPTPKGWTKDVYQLGHTEDKEEDSLFDKIQEYRDTEMAEQHRTNTSRLDKRTCSSFFKDLCSEPREPDAQRKLIREQKKLTEKSIELRKTHWNRIEKTLEELVKDEQLTTVDPEVIIENYWSDSAGPKLWIHVILTLAIFATGLGSYAFIARNVELSVAVSEGMNALGSDNVGMSGWICLILFWVLIIIYFHREWKYSILDTLSSLKYVCTGCKKESKSIETVFNTPEWENAPEEFRQFMENQNKKSKRNLAANDVNLEVEEE